MVSDEVWTSAFLASDMTISVLKVNATAFKVVRMDFKVRRQTGDRASLDLGDSRERGIAHPRGEPRSQPLYPVPLSLLVVARLRQAPSARPACLLRRRALAVHVAAAGSTERRPGPTAAPGSRRSRMTCCTGPAGWTSRAGWPTGP